MRQVAWTRDAYQDCERLADQLIVREGKDVALRVLDRLGAAAYSMYHAPRGEFRRAQIEGLEYFGVNGTDIVLVCRREAECAIVLGLFEGAPGPPTVALL